VIFTILFIFLHEESLTHMFSDVTIRKAGFCSSHSLMVMVCPSACFSSRIARWLLILVCVCVCVCIYIYIWIWYVFCRLVGQSKFVFFNFLKSLKHSGRCSDSNIIAIMQ
jgi:hypothetical protein